MTTDQPQSTFTLGWLFTVVTLIAALFGTAVVAAREPSVPVVIGVFSISLVAQVAFVLLQTTPEVRRAFAIGFLAALCPLSFVAMIHGAEPFVLVSIGSRAPNAVLPYFESALGATLVALVIAVISGLFVASGRLFQRRRFGLLSSALFLLLLWMFLWEIAVEVRKEKPFEGQAGRTPSSAVVSSAHVKPLEFAAICNRPFRPPLPGLTTGCACAKTWGCAGRGPADPRLP